MPLKSRRPLLAALTIAVPAVAFAHNGATGIVGERMMAMMMLSEQVKALTPAVETGAATQAQVDAAARMILMHSGTAMTKLFPEGRADALSEALPAIWERWDDFTSRADELEALAQQLLKVRVEAPSPAVDVRPGQPTEWERLSFASLIGGEPNPLTHRPEPHQHTPADGPELEVVFDRIVKTCSSCHAEFRR